jgi:hypothetical protein
MKIAGRQMFITLIKTDTILGFLANTNAIAMKSAAMTPNENIQHATRRAIVSHMVLSKFSHYETHANHSNIRYTLQETCTNGFVHEIGYI